MTEQEQLDNGLIKYANEGDLVKIQSFIEQGAYMYAKNDEAFRLSTRLNHLEIVKYLVALGTDIHAENDEALKFCAHYIQSKLINYFIFDCQMIVKKETLTYLEEHSYLETIEIINFRNSHNDLIKNLNSDIINNKMKVKN
jgi:hypothetical protein